MILDTSYFLDLLREDEAAFDAGMELHNEGVTGKVATPTLFETYYGVGATQSEAELRKVQNVLMGYPPVPITEGIARVAGELLGRVDAAAGGESGIGSRDAYIAATARVLDEPVFTRNESHFDRLGVEVITY
ncbi:MAG: PIN domain-containing protein [Halobacteriaceae archaeon]